MATFAGNHLYPFWKQALMQEIPGDKSLDIGDDVPAAGVYLALVTTDGGYVYSDSHQFYNSVTNVQGTPERITTPTVSGRVFSGDSAVYTEVSGTMIGAIILYRANAGTSDTWRLVLYEDTGIIGIPMLPNGGNIIVDWNDQGIFGL